MRYVLLTSSPFATGSMHITQITAIFTFCYKAITALILAQWGPKPHTFFDIRWPLRFISCQAWSASVVPTTRHFDVSVTSCVKNYMSNRSINYIVVLIWRPGRDIKRSIHRATWTEKTIMKTEVKPLQSSPKLHPTQTTQNHLNSSFVPLSLADLESAVAAAVINFKEITRHFPLSKIIH